jgi:class 3 adenylate cyclase/tetratricopeptide (TPR) repeat protein
MSGVAIVVFSDLVDSTALLATLGDDRMELVRRAHVSDVGEAVSGAGGRVVKTLGDGVMASFESALGALRAAAGIQAAVERLDRVHGGIGIAARVGVAAGEPIPDGEDLHGMAVVIASRLSSAASSGEVLVQDLVQALVASRDGVRLEGMGEYELKGVPAPVRAATLAWRELSRPVKQEGESEEEPAAEVEQPTRLARPDAIRLPPALAAYAEEPLIGRDREIAVLSEALAANSGRKAVLVVGEPGIGKTRHAAAAAAEAHAEGALVVMARCPPEVAVAFEPWVRAIGELALAGDDAWRGRLAEAAGAELTALVPELSEHVTLTDRAAADQIVAAEGARYRLFRGIGAALAFAADGAPLYVVFDDAHWCDPASAQALEHLMDGDLSGLSLVVTAREHEMGRGHPVSKALADLRRTGDLSELQLTGLDAPGLAVLVGARLDRAITPELATRLQTRTAGNPFFAAELARELDGQGALRDEDALDAALAPDAVADLVEGRLSRLDPKTERLLAAVAAIGPSAPVELAARAAGLRPEETESALAEALAERLGEDVPALTATIGFPHALVREALIARLGDAERARLHLAIARVLEEGDGTEPAELARHYGLSVDLVGTEPVIAAYRAAATMAAEAHDHEQAAVHLRSALSLLPGGDLEVRGAALLELGEQELLCADMVRARRSFQAAAAAARARGDARALAGAALGFAGGDIGFGWEAGAAVDVASIELLSEALDALGQSDPRLSLRVVFRLAYLRIIGSSEEEVTTLARRAAELGSKLEDPEAQLLSRYAQLVAFFTRSPDPLRVLDRFEDFTELLDLARECDRDDLLFRVVQMTALAHHIRGRIDDCDRAIEWAGEIAQRLGSPRFTWEVDVNRGTRLLDRGDREGGEALIRRAAAVVRRMRPDIHITVEAAGLLVSDWTFDGDPTTSRVVYEAMEKAMPRGLISAFITLAAAEEGDFETARLRIRALLDEDLESMRYPDGYMPIALWALALAVTRVGDREAGERLRPLLEPQRSRLIGPIPTVGFGHATEWHIGRLELLAGRLDAAIAELSRAVELVDEYEIVWQSAMARIDLARALHRSGDSGGAAGVLDEGEAIANRHGIGWARRGIAEARAELGGLEPESEPRKSGRARPIRALASRGGRRALAAMVGDRDDAELERRFADPARQRALVKGLARAFQPAHASGFRGVIAYELETFAIEPPPDSPWRWAIEVDAEAGRATLLEPAPLDAAVTIHIGLAEWVRVLAGVDDALVAMVAGRCSIEGDVVLAVRQEAMFGG